MKRILIAAALAVSATVLVFADGGGMGGGGMGFGGMGGGSGMLVVADDGSLLLTEMGMGGIMAHLFQVDNTTNDGSYQEAFRFAF